MNLHDALWAASRLEADSRFPNWVKRIIGINEDIDNGYCFEGAFINDRTVQIELEPAVYLVAATSGSRKHQHTTYRVVFMGKTGELHLSNIETDNTDAGWALRIRDQVADLLKTITE